jgi:hypothetical protein
VNMNVLDWDKITGNVRIPSFLYYLARSLSRANRPNLCWIALFR